MSHLLELLQTFMFYLKSDQLPQLGFWTYILLAALVAIEGPLATLLGAAAASAGLMRPIAVFAAAAFGNLSADVSWYTLGYLGKTDWLFRFGRRLGIRRDLLEHLKHNMIAHATKVLFLAKLTVSFVIPSLVAAGLLRVPLKRWLPALVVAETLWTGSLVLIGYYTTEAIKRVEEGIEYTILAVSLIFVTLLIVAGRRLIKEWERDDENPTSDDHQ